MKTSRAFALVAALGIAACTHRKVELDEHAGHDMSASASGTHAAASLPAGAADAPSRLQASPRHGEWVMYATAPDGTDSVRAWVVYPERKSKAPVVVVIHEIFGLSTWIRGVADQLAAEGYVAIAPDLLTSKLPANLSDSALQASGPAAIRTLRPEDVQRQLDATARYAMRLPGAAAKYATIGFCWGGSTSFLHASHAGSALSAAVVYYGTSPTTEQMASIRAPVIGLYGENDARVDMTIPRADSALKGTGRTYEPHIYPGAGHGFLRQQDGQNGANKAATEQAWPATIAFLRRTLGR